MPRAPKRSPRPSSPVIPPTRARWPASRGGSPCSWCTAPRPAARCGATGTRPRRLCGRSASPAPHFPRGGAKLGARPPRRDEGKEPSNAYRRFAGAPLGGGHAGPPLAAWPRSAGAETLSCHEGGPAPPDGSSRREPDRDRAALVGGRPQRARAGSRTSLSGPLRGHGTHRTREAGEPRPRAGLEEAAGHARHALHLPHRPAAALAHRRHRGLAVASRRAGWDPAHGAGAGIARRAGQDRRTSSRTASYDRSRRSAPVHPGAGRVRGLAQSLRAGEISQRGREGLGRPVAVERAVSLSRRASVHEDALRCLRASANVLGDRPHADALHLLRVHPSLHRALHVAQGRRSGAGDGPRRLRMARLASTGVRVSPTGRILGLVVLMTPLSGAGIDIYVPSLPSMTEHFHTTPALIQLTITFYLLGYGMAQRAIGAASEVLGRRPVVVVGSLIYTATALGVALAPTVSALLALRLLQGIALSATATLNRSILTDTFTGADLAKASNAMTLAWALGPI